MERAPGQIKFKSIATYILYITKAYYNFKFLLFTDRSRDLFSTITFPRSRDYYYYYYYKHAFNIIKTKICNQ